ncbi:MAG TPA: alpha-L-fucosidase [Planctomycetota bacterium]|nr:alpha-L-fucosidase [Planctomycetota bacterium]
MRTLPALLAAMALLGTGRDRAAGAASDPWKATAEAMQWWREARLGMFICWGPVSLKGVEIGWGRGKARPDQKQGGRGPVPAEVYDGLYKHWNPTLFDAKEWVAVAKDAGARYIIFLVKHHDGFCLFDTKLTDYRITSPLSPFRRDIAAEVAQACREAGIKLLWYYSQPDWHHPDYRTANHARYIEYLHGQLRELCSRYGRIDGIWFDGLGGSARDWDAEGLFKLIRELQPHAVINNRCGLPGDFDTPEQRIGRFQGHRPWESCITLGTQWAWKPDDRIKSLKECVDTLVRCAGGDGDLALNTNPMPDGRIEPRQAERFREIGAWLKRYGEAIYATRGGPFRPAPWGAATCKGKTVYLHILKWDHDALTLPAIPRKILSSRLLTGGTVALKQTKEGIELSVPKPDRQELDTIVALDLDGPALEISSLAQASGSLAAGKKAKASNVFRNQAEFSPEKAFDDDLSTRWGCDWGTKAAWLEVDLGQPTTFARAVICEPYDRVREFELQCRDSEGDAWRTFHRGTTIGERLELRCQPVTARFVRLNLRTVEGPSIWEFQLYAPQKP